MENTPQKDLRAAENMNAFFIVPARAKSSIKTLFMTHPPTEQRIARLMEYERQLQTAA
jgi:heat shock protein HtpX